MSTTLSPYGLHVASAECDEPDGMVIRYVYPMPLSRDNLMHFWIKAKPFRTVFGNAVKDFGSFCELFLSMDSNGFPRAHGLFYVVDDFVGVYYVNHITPIDALVHYTFFDKRQKGREGLTREMLRYGFSNFGFRRLSVEIPKYAKTSVFGFVYGVGFKREGEKRMASLNPIDNTWYDTVQFGILREEILGNGGMENGNKD